MKQCDTCMCMPCMHANDLPPGQEQAASMSHPVHAALHVSLAIAIIAFPIGALPAERQRADAPARIVLCVGTSIVL